VRADCPLDTSNTDIAHPPGRFCGWEIAALSDEIKWLITDADEGGRPDRFELEIIVNTDSSAQK
jgi:hypothetical protein